MAELPEIQLPFTNVAKTDCSMNFGGVVDVKTAEANAALIVRAVNNFDAMREALEFYAMNKPDNGILAKKTLEKLTG